MPKPKVGELFQNRYLILSELGAGGMGLVFRARQVDVEREVALKSIRNEEVHDEETVARFYREFQLLSRLIHPNIVTIYGLALDDSSLPFAICELIEGTNLRSVLVKEGPLSWNRASAIVLQITQAMQYAHEQGVIHRDLKPDNVMLVSVPEPDFVKLVDFGLSRVAQSEGEASQMLTSTGQLIGSANYMSPEQIKQRADARSDIYSLGCLFFELLSGEYLFDADNSIGIVYKHTQEDPAARFSAIKSRIPKRVISILSRSLAKDPDERYQTMSAMAADLQAMVDQPEPFIESGESKKIEALSGRKFLTVLIIALVILLPAFLFSSQHLSPTKEKKIEKQSRRNYAETVLLPVHGAAMETLLAREKDYDAKDILARRWLEKYGNANLPVEDKLIVKEYYARNKVSLSDAEQCVTALNELAAFMPRVPENNMEAIQTKEGAYHLLFDTFLFLGRKKEAIESARADLKMLRDNEEKCGWLESSNFAVSVLMLCGDYSSALDFQKHYEKKLYESIGLSAYHYFRLLGDLHSCVSDFKVAEKAYEHASSTLNSEDKSVTIGAITGLSVGQHGFSGKGTRMGIPILCLAEREYYLDPQLGCKHFKVGLDLLVAEQSDTDKLVRSGNLLSRAFMTAQLPSKSWLILSRMARGFNLEEEAERCARMAVLSANNMDAKANRRESAAGLAAQATCLLVMGKESAARDAFSKMQQCLKRLQSDEGVTLGSQYSSVLAELAARKGFSKSAAYYLKTGGAYFADLKSLKGEGNYLGLEALLYSAAALYANGRIADAEAFFKIIESMPTSGVIKDLEFDGVLLGFPPNEANDMQGLERWVTDYALAAVVDTFLRLGMDERACSYLKEKEKTVSDKVSISLAHFKLGQYYLARNQKELARAHLQIAHDVYTESGRLLILGRGLPLNVRCKLLLGKL